MAISVITHNTKVHVGDTVKVHYRIVEKEVVAGKTKREKKEEKKERVQIFEGMVISIRGTGEGRNFVVRRMGIDNVGIERIFPLNSPWITNITVSKTGDVRRAKLYYLRKKTKREIAKISENSSLASVANTELTPEVKEETPAPQPVQEDATAAQPAQG